MTERTAVVGIGTSIPSVTAGAPLRARPVGDRQVRNDSLRGDITLCAPPGSRSARQLRATLHAHGIAFHGAIRTVALDRTPDGRVVLVAPSSDYLLLVDGDLAEDPDHTVDLLAALLHNGSDLAVSRSAPDAPFDGLAARHGAWAPLEGGFVGIDRIIEQGSWVAGTAVTRAGDAPAVVVQPLDPADRGQPAQVPLRRRVLRSPATLAALAVAIQAGFVFGAPRSPFTDESIYVVMGQRALGGHSGDGFLQWVTGSQLYPALAAAVSTSGGHAVVSLLSAVLVALVALVCGRATRHLDRPDLEYATVAAVLVPGIMLWFGHQVNHDLGVLIGVAAALWCISRYRVNQRRSRLVWAGLAAAAGGLSAYAGLLMLIPLSLLTLQVTGWRQWRRALPYFAAAGLPVALYAAANVGNLDALSAELQRQAPFLATPRDKVALQLLFVGIVPLVLALLGFGRSGLSWLTKAVLVGGLLLVPLVHVFSGVEQASLRHSAYGIPLAAPLLGSGLHSMVQRRNGTVSAPLAAAAAANLICLGTAQAALLDRDWVDVRPTLDYLAVAVQPGEKILTEHQWPVTERLLAEARITDPWAVYSEERVDYEGLEPDYCAFTWFVEDSSEEAAARSRAQVEACGTFVPVFTQSGSKVRFDDDRRYRTTAATITVWRNTAPSGGEVQVR
jgi:hypothetical protein